jgi:Rrf2 family iron-sulfur cluster assembly transcriptional regulator
LISQTSRYALHILSYLVKHRENLVRGEQIAEATGIPLNYLSKILNQLRKSGIVQSQKGWHGGFKLRGRALGRPIRDVLAVIDGEEAAKRKGCALGLPECDLDNPCPLHHQWEGIRQGFVEMVTSTKIRDLADSR